jgi:hypothetical protein
MKRFIAVGILILLSSGLGVAHHSLAPIFSTDKTASITGTVVRIVWALPHPGLYLDVKDATGATKDWYFEGSSIRGLKRQGWSGTTLKPGDTVSVCGLLGKPNAAPGLFPPGVTSARAMHGVDVLFPDGRKLLFMGGNVRSCAAGN